LKPFEQNFFAFWLSDGQLPGNCLFHRRTHPHHTQQPQYQSFSGYRIPKHGLKSLEIEKRQGRNASCRMEERQSRHTGPINFCLWESPEGPARGRKNRNGFAFSFPKWPSNAFVVDKSQGSYVSSAYEPDLRGSAKISVGLSILRQDSFAWCPQDQIVRFVGERHGDDFPIHGLRISASRATE
jgi:hypothetical protein